MIKELKEIAQMIGIEGARIDGIVDKLKDEGYGLKEIDGRIASYIGGYLAGKVECFHAIRTLSR